MRTYDCTCGNRLFFDSTTCLKCGAATADCPACRCLVPLVPSDNDTLLCGAADCGTTLQMCGNRDQNGCNRGLPVDASDSAAAVCDLCALTTVIPDLTVEGNQDRWTRLERAKCRVLKTLDLIHYPFRPDNPANTLPLTFEFKADGEEPVHTGHRNGCITINIREADDVERERARVAFQEPKRTLVEHFRHELGHYFWDREVKNRCEPAFRAVFGDERQPTYAEALQRYHDSGPADDWHERCVSAYSSMHPWEDFAETFRLYLDMITMLDTSEHFGIVPTTNDNPDAMIIACQRVGTIANELNRDMGLLDLVPEIIVAPVVDKIRFIASLPA